MIVPALSRRRSQTADEAVEGISSGMRVFLSGNCGTPQSLAGALVRRAPMLRDVEVVQALAVGPAPYTAAEMAGHLRLNTLFISDSVRAAVSEGRADFTPCFLSEIPGLFRSRLPLDVALIQLSPPDEHGFCSFGVEVGLSKPAAHAARTIVAEINPRMPRTLGDAFIHISRLDRVVEVDAPLPEIQMASGDATTERIAERVASLIPDGATLQTGIGAVPDAVLRRLTDRKDLGVHTELFSDGILELVERGVINGERKTLHPGKIVAGFLLGSRRLYDFVDDNPVVELHPSDYVNDPFVIAGNDRMVAINSALEVDLTGQVCADSRGPRLYSGVGGQVDFLYGAARSRGGIPIIALRSTWRGPDGVIGSRIVPTLKPGAGVVTTRSHVHFIVTEHGIADLYGKTISQRVHALVAIAAPEYRDTLLAAARTLRYV